MTAARSVRLITTMQRPWLTAPSQDEWPLSALQTRWPDNAAETAFRFEAVPLSGIWPEDRFTVVLNTFKRPALLLRALRHYATCGSQVAAIRVVWSEQRPPPDATSLDGASFHLLDLGRDAPPVRYDAHPTTSINNRFAPLAEPAGAAVFSVDDDMVVPCAALADAFAAWRAAPHALVGFYPRLHERVAAPAACGVGAAARYRYISAEPALLLRGRFSLILTKAAFLHADYLRMYTHAMPAAVRDFVGSRRECEDIAMAFLIANATRGAVEAVNPSVWVRPPFGFWLGAKLDGVGRSGISSGQVKGHHALRGGCIAYFSRFYGGTVPLIVQPLVDSALRAPRA